VGLSPRYLKIGGRWRDHERWTLLVEDWKKAGKTRFPSHEPALPGREGGALVRRVSGG
jgi:hypothetical protein